MFNAECLLSDYIIHLKWLIVNINLNLKKSQDKEKTDRLGQFFLRLFRQAISRILSPYLLKKGEGDDHLSRPDIANRLKQATFQVD